MSRTARVAVAAAAWIVGGMIIAALVMWPLGTMLVIAVGFAGAGVAGTLYLLVVITLEWVRGAQAAASPSVWYVGDDEEGPVRHLPASSFGYAYCAVCKADWPCHTAKGYAETQP